MEDADFGAEDFDVGKTLEKSLSSLEFNFDTLENYDIDNAAAEQNEKFTTFSVNGKQVSAFINDLVTYLLSAENSPVLDMIKGVLPAGLHVEDYIKVASVTIMNTPLATADGAAIYDQKDTALGIAVSIRLRDLVKAAMQTEEIKDKLSSVPSFALNLIPSLVPKFFSASVTVYPLAPEADNREVVVTVNKPSEKNAKRLATLVNALLSGKDDADPSRTFFAVINDKVSSTFSSINETVKINFVPSKDKNGEPLKDEKGNAYSEMKIMTWDTVLSLIAKDGNVSAHDILTMMKCLHISNDAHSELDTDTALSAFKTDMSGKYGVDNEYLKEINVLSTDDLSGMAEHIDLSTVNLKENNEEMRVRLSAEALAAFMKQYVTKTDDAVAAAEEGGSSSLFEGLTLKISNVTIKKEEEKDGVSVYSLELGLLVRLQEMLENMLPSDGGIGETLFKKLLPKEDSYFCIKLYLSEYHDAESDKLVHKVGKNIDAPTEGESLYLSKIRINDFDYDDTARVFDAIDNILKVWSEDGFKISSITGNIEDMVNDVFNSIAGNDFNVEMRLYEKSEESNDQGGLSLPSLYELLKNVVKPKLESGETFEIQDARNVLLQIYQNKDVDMSVSYEDADATAFIDEINDKYYIKKASALQVSDLFGDGASALSDKIKADSIYFKYDGEEAALWTEEKKCLYGDNRTVSALRVRLSGTEIAALVKESNLIPDDLASSFGAIEVLGATFNTEEKKTYLTFHLKLVKKEDDGDLKFGKAMPSDVKLSAKILLFANSYSEEEPRFSSHVTINDAASEKTFLLLKALGGGDLSEKSISDKISQSVATTFNTLEGKIPLSYTDKDGNPHKLGEEDCILISDVFSFLVKETTMTDLGDVPTDPQDLADRLRGFGRQTVGDRDNEGTYTWLNNVNLFAYSDDGDDTNDDDYYIYKNMKDAYFMKSEISLNDIYGDGTFSNKFNEIKTTSFNLKENANGLFYYNGAIKNLKISDKALGVIVKKKQDFSQTVNGEGMTPEIMSLKLSLDGTDLIIESGVKIAFDNRSAYYSMPSYFFVIAKTVKSGTTYTTTLSMNNLATADTDQLFKNILSLESKGLKADSFDKEKIENTISTEIKKAFDNLPSSVTFGAFTSTDLTTYYHTGSVYPVNCSLPSAGDGYLSFPSVYSYMIDIFYTASEKATYHVTEEEMQSMLLALHSTTVESDIVTNAKSSTAYHVTKAFKDNSLADYVLIYSDKYLAHEISSRLGGEKINGDISLADSIEQSILLRNGLGSATWGDWEEKFYIDPDTASYNATHDYLISTVKVSLSGYGAGNADLLPNDLYLSVLLDLNASDQSKGLLYNMSHKDMEIFSFIMHKYNNQFESVDNMAEQLATIINDKLALIKNIYIEELHTNINFTLNYRLNTDTFSYTTSLPFSSGAALNVKDEWNDDGVGYVILSQGAIS